MTPLRPLFVALCLPAIAFADAPLTQTATAGNTLTAPPAAWLGETPHLVMMGHVNGYGFDLQLPDMAAAEGVASFEGKREYLVDGDALRYIDFEFTLEAVIAGAEKAIELEFENFDFAAEAVPGDFTLQGEEFPPGALSNMEVEFEWEIDGTSVNEEVAAWDGTLSLAQDTGTPAEDNTLQEGMIGGYVSARRGEDVLVVSFTVPVTEVEIED